MDGFETALTVLPREVRAAAARLPAGVRGRVEELRLRTGRPPAARLAEGEVSLPGVPEVTPETLRTVMELATGASWHAAEDSLRRGFVTVSGGCRIGICGQAVMEQGRVASIRELSSLCIRIPREIRGCADGLLEGEFTSTILISPPSGGKTTLLREMCRCLSDGGLPLALCDERGEVAAVWNGRAQFDVGIHTDVLTGAPKGEGAMMLLRSMAPRILALDEITAPEDVDACLCAANCGVRLLVTAHGSGTEDLFSRGVYRRLVEQKLFQRAVVIRVQDGRRHYRVERLR